MTVIGRYRLVGWIAAAILAAPLAALAGALPLENDSGVPSVAPIVKQVMPAVVNIAVRGTEQIDNPLLRDPLFRRFFNVPNGPITRETQAKGSGVIVDAQQGVVLTNNHVIEHANLIEVTLTDKRHFKAKLVGHDAATDIAVLRIPAEGLTALGMADSDKSEVGDFVLALGNPFGLGQTVTSGIVSAIGRSDLGIEGLEDFIQTDAAINPGNSGGALVDLKGRLIGINTAILAPSGGNVGVGFAIPSNMARTVMQQILQYGRVDRGWIGVGAQDLTPELALGLQTSRREGAVVSTVEAGAGAQHAGLKTGDIIVGVNGAPVHSWQQCVNQIGLTRIGDAVTLTVDRRGETLTIPVTVGPRPQNSPRMVRQDPQDDADQ